eukprot:8897456-Lingulodinium_polyedra.AAC.1
MRWFADFTEGDTQGDARLRRLASYIWSPLDERLVGCAAKGDKTCGLHLYPDADLGGCSATQRSTSG